MSVCRIGDTHTFALEFEFCPDPDKGSGATQEESLSWGWFSIWVEGTNLCQYLHGSERSEAVQWYLLPLIEWFTANWGPMLYEETPPTPTDRGLSARSLFFEYGKQRYGCMPETEEDLWYQWGQRHSLRAAASGGIFPDVYMRGAGDKVEFSWGNAPFPGYPEPLLFTAQAGTSFAYRTEVERVMLEFLGQAVAALCVMAPESRLFRELKKAITRIEQEKEGYISWMIPAVSKGRISFGDLIARIRHFVPGLEFAHGIPAPVLMFGSCSPAIQQKDIETILEGLAFGGESPELAACARAVPFTHGQPYVSGYTSAEDFLDRIDMDDDFIDIEKILASFSVRTVTADFSDRTMRGIALAGKGLHPTIYTNTRHPNNATPEGRRYTLAHEFCHVLHDRQYGQEVGVVSGPWAPLRVEQRANAFAAMLLMPVELIARHRRRFTDLNIAAIRHMADTLRVSRSALIEHLYNIGMCTMLERDELREHNTTAEHLCG